MKTRETVTWVLVASSVIGMMTIPTMEAEAEASEAAREVGSEKMITRIMMILTVEAETGKVDRDETKAGAMVIMTKMIMTVLQARIPDEDLAA